MYESESSKRDADITNLFPSKITCAVAPFTPPSFFSSIMKVLRGCLSLSASYM